MVRSGLVESVHRGSVVLLDADGRVALRRGEVSAPMLPRSSNKPLQLAGMLRCGLRLEDPADLAIATASHNGEDGHIRRVITLLERHGLGPDHLACPPALPLHPPTAGAVLAAGGGPVRATMNCSGKHAAMLVTCVQRGWPTTGYPEPEHPVQRGLAATVAELAGEPVTATAVDGCGAPLFALSLTGLATAFARLARAAPSSAEGRVTDAMRAHPWLVAGTGREDTRLLRALPGLVCKSGAEGVHAGALPDGRAFALKIEDGAARARMPVTVGALRALGVTDADLNAGTLEELAAEPVRGGGRVVGEVRLLSGVL